MKIELTKYARDVDDEGWEEDGTLDIYPDGDKMILELARGKVVVGRQELKAAVLAISETCEQCLSLPLPLRLRSK